MTALHNSQESRVSDASVLLVNRASELHSHAAIHEILPGFDSIDPPWSEFQSNCRSSHSALGNYAKSTKKFRRVNMFPKKKKRSEYISDLRFFFLSRSDRLHVSIHLAFSLWVERNEFFNGFHLKLLWSSSIHLKNVFFKSENNYLKCFLHSSGKKCELL